MREDSNVVASVDRCVADAKLDFVTVSLDVALNAETGSLVQFSSHLALGADCFGKVMRIVTLRTVFRTLLACF